MPVNYDIEYPKLQQKVNELRNSLMTACDLVAEGISGSASYDYEARAEAFINEIIASEK